MSPCCKKHIHVYAVHLQRAMKDTVVRYGYVKKGRVAAKRGQEKQTEKMVKKSNKNKLRDVRDNVLVPIPLVDKRSPIAL